MTSASTRAASICSCTSRATVERASNSRPQPSVRTAKRWPLPCGGESGQRWSTSKVGRFNGSATDASSLGRPIHPISITWTREDESRMPSTRSLRILLVAISGWTYRVISVTSISLKSHRTGCISFSVPAAKDMSTTRLITRFSYGKLGLPHKRRFASAFIRPTIAGRTSTYDRPSPEIFASPGGISFNKPITSCNIQTISLLTTDELRERLSKTARKLVEEDYDWDVIGKGLLDVYDSVLI